MRKKGLLEVLVKAVISWYDGVDVRVGVGGITVLKRV